VLSAAPDPDFCHGHPNNDQQDCRLNIRATADTKSRVWLSEKEVKPHRRGQCRENTSEPVAVRRDRHDHDYEGEGNLRVGKAGTKRRKDGG
jgi:hypothetical protein